MKATAWGILSGPEQESPMTKAERMLRASLIADKLGRTKASIAVMTQTEASLKAKLKELGVSEAEGEVFRVTVSTYDKEVRDDSFKSLIEALVLQHTSPQYRAKHVEIRETTSVRVVARTRKEAA